MVVSPGGGVGMPPQNHLDKVPQEIYACQSVKCPRLEDVSGAPCVWRGSIPPAMRDRSAAAPQLPDEVLSSPGQVGGVAGDEIVGGFTPLAFPAGQEEHLKRRQGGDSETDGTGGPERP